MSGNSFYPSSIYLVLDHISSEILWGTRSPTFKKSRGSRSPLKSMWWTIPFHYKSDTSGDQGDRSEKEDKGDDLYQEFCEIVY